MADIAITLKTGTAPYRLDTIKKIPIHNFGDNINFTIQNSAGAALDITGTTPKFTLYRAGPRHEMEQDMQKDCTIISGPGGTCRYTVLAGDFNHRSVYFGRVEIFTGTTKIDSTQDFLMEVV
ncbi:MAG: BppU family phage baseplate upper protein [Nitrososphaerales archaeon]